MIAATEMIADAYPAMGFGGDVDRSLDKPQGFATVGTLIMASEIYDQLRADIITAMKARASATTTALRTADAAIKRAELDGNVPIDDALVLATLRKAVKNLSDAREDFAKAGRADLVAANDTEIALLSKYLPQPLSSEALAALIVDAIAATGATAKRDMGRVITALKAHEHAGQIDFATASKLIQTKLG